MVIQEVNDPFSRSFCGLEKKRTVSFSDEKKEDEDVPVLREQKLGRTKTIAAALAESARKGIQRSATFHQPLMSLVMTEQ